MCLTPCFLHHAHPHPCSESVSLSSVGLGLTVLLPSAFVAFPAGAVESLPPRPRLRIVTAGAFHNLLFWLTLVASASTHLHVTLFSLLGYGNVSKYGRVVVDVDQVSTSIVLFALRSSP